MMKHSSVDGLMGLSTVQEVYDMIAEYARGFVDASSNAEAKAIQQRTKDRKRFPDQSGVRNSGEMECFGCGSKDHVLKDGLKKQTTSQQNDKNQKTLSPRKTTTGQFQSRTSPTRQVDWSRTKVRSGKEYFEIRHRDRKVKERDDQVLRD